MSCSDEQMCFRTKRREFGGSGAGGVVIIGRTGQLSRYVFQCCVNSY